MRIRLLDLAVCPCCGGQLHLIQATAVEGDEILSGELQCPSRHVFPILGGVPRLLPPDLLAESLKQHHPTDYRRYRNRLGPSRAKEARLTKDTLHSFSFQWREFSQMYDHWEANFKSYFEPLVKPRDFESKLVLDAGCGFGRHTYYASKYGAEVVAMDLSEAVEAAFKNNRGNEQVHVVQGDIYWLPLKPVFDLVYCIGVIQHLPEPGRGFERLNGILAPGGQLFVWVYGLRRGLYRLVDYLRKSTTSMSMQGLYRLTWALNLLSYTSFCLPYKLLRRLSQTRKVAEAIPFTRYADLPLRVGHADWFDRLAVPSTVYFSRNEVEGWYQGAGFEQYQVENRENIGWKGLGRKVVAVAAQA